jgi:colicin import membrane protein
MTAMTDATPYIVPKEPGRWRAIGMAALVHAALLAFLWVGVRWQNETPTTIEAEVWSPQPREAAPPPEPVKPAEPEPKPVIKETPKPAIVEPPVAKPDIALEQEKKRKALEQKRLEEEREAKLKKQKELKAEEDRLAKLKEEQRLQKEKADKAQKDKDKALVDAKQKAVADAKRKQQEADDKQLAKIREEELKRITGGVTGTGGSGEAAKSQGGRADSGYAGRVAAKIKSNISFIVPEELAANAPVEYVVDLLPDGSVAGIRKTKSSGVPGFDEAVRRAIEKSQPYPKDRTGSVPSSFIGIHRPKDQ